MKKVIENTAKQEWPLQSGRAILLSDRCCNRRKPNWGPACFSFSVFGFFRIWEFINYRGM
jgi:hypothetical protein